MNFNLVRFLDKNIGIPICYSVYIFRKIFSKKQTVSQPKCILLVRLWGIGTILLASPTFRALRKKFPKAKIVLLTLKRNEGIYDGSKLFDEIIYFDLKTITGVFLEFFKTMRILRGYNFDLAIDFEPFARITTILISLSKTKTIVGYYTEKQGKAVLYDKSVVWNNKQHVTKSFLEILKLFDAYPKNIEIEKIPCSSEDKKYVDNILSQQGIKKSDKIVGLNVNASDFGTARRWPYQKFAKLADQIIDRFKVKVVFIGASFDKELVEKTICCMRNKGAVNLSGTTTIKQLAALSQRFTLFITNDSGPMHIAYSMGTPTITFFGPETPLIYGPLGEKHTVFYKNLPCSPCLSVYNAKRINCDKDAECIKSITVDEVMKKVANYLK